MNPSQSSHRQNYVDMISTEIIQYAEENGLTPANAAVRIILQWLAYDEGDVRFIDSRDRGIDAWNSTDDSLEVFQIKTRSPTRAGTFPIHKFDRSGVTDLSRAITFLLHETRGNIREEDLRNLLTEWEALKYRHQQYGNEEAILVGVNLLVLGEGLTEGGHQEFEALRKQYENPHTAGDAPIQFVVNLYTVDDIINNRWREDNREWRDGKGEKLEVIPLSPTVSKADSYISDDDNAVFYCKAIDLVNAFDSLGYQLFEPNVRANIRKSAINKAIRDSVTSRKSRREFRFLNNGVTIVCDGFERPRGGRRHFKVNRPGIVNGLQTVVALHTAYHELDKDSQHDFESKCSVLIRILNAKAVSDVTSVVRATNNQNPMQPRNLVSNNTEQIQYVRLFAEKGWFFEAKQGAWDAFSSDPKRWRPDLKKRKQDFLVPGGRKRARRINNEQLAQIWLAFIGFAGEAADNRRKLFEDKYYDLIYTSKTKQHGKNCESIERAKHDATRESPSPSLLLIAQLAWEYVREVTPSAQLNRLQTCERLNINPADCSRDQLDAKLSDDDEYVLNQALKNMSLLFTEFVGYVFFESIGERLHSVGERILGNGSFQYLSENYQLDIVRDRVFDGDFKDNDLLIILWLVFHDLVRDMVTMNWGTGYKTAPVKKDYIFSEETRRRLYNGFEDQNKFMKKRILPKPWATGIKEGNNVCDFVRVLVLGS